MDGRIRKLLGMLAVDMSVSSQSDTEYGNCKDGKAQRLAT
jgi:hypothetical protein